MVASFHVYVYVYVYVYVRVPACVFHYENTPIQIFRKIHLQKLKIFRQKKVWYFFKLLLKIKIVGTR